MELCFQPGRILLPGEEIRVEQWACLACDQYTSQPDYWQEAAALAGEDAVLMGGAQLYRALLPRCERVLVTQVDAAAEGADAFFPNLDAAPDWTAETVGEWQEENGLRFRYVDYVRRT